MFKNQITHPKGVGSATGMRKAEIGGWVRLDMWWGSDCEFAIVYHYIERVIPREVEHRLDRGLVSD